MIIKNIVRNTKDSLFLKLGLFGHYTHNLIKAHTLNVGHNVIKVPRKELLRPNGLFLPSFLHLMTYRLSVKTLIS